MEGQQHALTLLTQITAADVARQLEKNEENQGCIPREQLEVHISLLILSAFGGTAAFAEMCTYCDDDDDGFKLEVLEYFDDADYLDDKDYLIRSIRHRVLNYVFVQMPEVLKRMDL